MTTSVISSGSVFIWTTKTRNNYQFVPESSFGSYVGDIVYLHVHKNDEGSSEVYTYSYTRSSESVINNTETDFYFPIYKNVGVGKIEQIQFGCIVYAPWNDGTVTDITHITTTNASTVSTVGGTESVVFIGEGLTTISNGTNNEVVIGTSFTETPQDLSLEVDSGTASINLSGSTNTIKISGSGDVTITEGSTGEFVVGSTFTETPQNLSSTVSGGTVTISLSGSSDTIVVKEGTGIDITKTNRVITISSNVTGNTGTVTGISSSVDTNSATVSVIGGGGEVIFEAEGGIYIREGGSDKIIIGSTASDSSSSYSGPFAASLVSYNLSGGVLSVSDKARNTDDAGKVYIGTTMYTAAGTRAINVLEGSTVYLHGSTNSSGELVFEYTTSNIRSSKSETSVNLLYDFFIPIALYEGNGVFSQIQYGDIFYANSYNGSFACFVDHVDETTPTTLWVVMNEGTTTIKNVRKYNSITTPVAIPSGQSLWLEMVFGSSTLSASTYVAESPRVASATKREQRIAYNDGGVLRQIQYGDIVAPNGVQRIIAGNGISVNNSGYGDVTVTASISGMTSTVVDDTSATITLVGGGTGSAVFVPDGSITIKGNTAGEIVIGSEMQDLVFDYDIATGIASIGLSGSTEAINIVGEGSIALSEGTNGELIVGSTATVTGLTSSVSGITAATISTVGGTGNIVIKGGSNTYITNGSAAGEIIIGSTVSAVSSGDSGLPIYDSWSALDVNKRYIATTDGFIIGHIEADESCITGTSVEWYMHTVRRLLYEVPQVALAYKVVIPFCIPIKKGDVFGVDSGMGGGDVWLDFTGYVEEII